MAKLYTSFKAMAASIQVALHNMGHPDATVTLEPDNEWAAFIVEVRISSNPLNFHYWRVPKFFDDYQLYKRAVEILVEMRDTYNVQPATTERGCGKDDYIFESV